MTDAPKTTRELLIAWLRDRHDQRGEFPRDMPDERLRRAIEVPHERSLWGQPHVVTPRLADAVFGDGRTLIGITPCGNRPNYYVVRIDGEWSLSNWDMSGRDNLSEHSDQIIRELEDQFGHRWDYDEDDNAVEDERPDAVSAEDGYSWFELPWPYRSPLFAGGGA